MSHASLLLSKRAFINNKIILSSIMGLVESNEIASFRMTDGLYVTSNDLHSAESTIAESLYRISSSYVRSYEIEHFKFPDTLHEHQLDAIISGIKYPLSVVTGGPGTGKTTILKQIIDVLMENGHKKSDILLCAPTGKAAKRMADSCNIEAVTLHRALKYDGNGGFSHDECDPLPFNVIVIDESSMLDVQISSSFFKAVKSGTRVLIVGDIDQLTSVGLGKVLCDIIRSNVIPVTRLTKVFRQEGGSKIIDNAHRVNKGLMPIIDNKAVNNDFWFVEVSDDKEIAKKCVEMVDRFANHFGYDKKQDIQILSPQRKSDCGQYALNSMLQASLNPVKPVFKINQDMQDIDYRIGDKIMQIQNNYAEGIFNGEVGVIKGYEKKNKLLSIDFDGKRAPYGPDALNEVRLGYCMTVHKSQGSEYPCIIMPLSLSHSYMLNRNLFYTGITRARHHVVIVGQRKAIEIAVSKVVTDTRVTALRHFLVELFPKK